MILFPFLFSIFFVQFSKENLKISNWCFCFFYFSSLVFQKMKMEKCIPNMFSVKVKTDSSLNKEGLNASHSMKNCNIT